MMNFAAFVELTIAVVGHSMVRSMGLDVRLELVVGPMGLSDGQGAKTAWIQMGLESFGLMIVLDFGLNQSLIPEIVGSAHYWVHGIGAQSSDRSSMAQTLIGQIFVSKLVVSQETDCCFH